MKLRILRSWRRHRAGDFIDFPDGVANVLIKRRIASAVEGDRPKTKPKPKGNK